MIFTTCDASANFRDLHCKGHADKIVSRTIELDCQLLRRKIDVAQLKMTAVFFVMRFNVAPIVIWIFELPLDQEIRAVCQVIRIWFGLERGLVVVAIAEDRSGYVVGVKMHASPQPHIRFKKAYRDPC